jgi:hypothetical protein
MLAMTQPPVLHPACISPVHPSNVYSKHLFKEAIMKSIIAAAALGLFFSASNAYANEPTEKDAIALVEKGAAFMKAKGKDEMIKRINAKDPDFVQSSLYLKIGDSSARAG